VRIKGSARKYSVALGNWKTDDGVGAGGPFAIEGALNLAEYRSLIFG